MISTALISDCGLYRYRLDRRWATGPTCGFIMLNPSTADADHDDPTIRRCIGFAKREGCGALVVVNLYAFRTPKPEVLWATEPLTRIGGRQQEISLHQVISKSDIIIAAWGAATRGADRWVRTIHAPFQCLGKTKSGAPRHPLYVRADAPLVPL